LSNLDGTFTSALDALAASAEWSDIDSYHPSSPFDEIPLYSRDSDVAFFDGRPIREANEVLLRYSARFLADLVGTRLVPNCSSCPGSGSATWLIRP